MAAWLHLSVGCISWPQVTPRVFKLLKAREGLLSRTKHMLLPTRLVIVVVIVNVISIVISNGTVASIVAIIVIVIIP